MQGSSKYSSKKLNREVKRLDRKQEVRIKRRGRGNKKIGRVSRGRGGERERETLILSCQSLLFHSGVFTKNSKLELCV